MLDIIRSLTEGIEDKVISYRRDFHRFAESGWLEIRTASIVAHKLKELGYDVKFSEQVISPKHRMGLPEQAAMNMHYERALEQGAVPEYAKAMKNGFTGVCAVKRFGPGPVIAMRFDMDALDLNESMEESHRPFREGFASVNENMMHACGHDGHTAAGLGIAEVLMKSGVKTGTLMLIFQPAEEGVRGALAMVETGLLDNADILLGHHVFSGWKTGEIAAGMGGYHATEKFDAVIKGAPAHAGGVPEGGKNAMLAAANAVLNLYAIPRHSKGSTRINVGKLNAGTGRNVICSSAKLTIETRGADMELSRYMYDKAVNVVEHSSKMYNCDYEIIRMGSAPSGNSDDELSETVRGLISQTGDVSFVPRTKLGGSEDFTYMMNRVAEHGGRAVNIGFGADLNNVGYFDKERHNIALRHHTSEFDFDEAVLSKIIIALSHIYAKLTEKQ